MFVSTQDGWTALHLAAHEGKVDVVRLLLTEAQTLVNIQNKVYKQVLATVTTIIMYYSGVKDPLTLQDQMGTLTLLIFSRTRHSTFTIQ